jgi:hypothetical protein
VVKRRPPEECDAIERFTNFTQEHILPENHKFASFVKLDS